MLKLKQYRDAAVGLPDLLNYALMPDEGIVQGKDGSLMASWYFRGEDMGSSTAQELAQLSARLNHALVQLGSGWMIHVDAIRQYARSYPPLCPFPDRTTLVIDAERRVQYEQEAAHLESVYAMTLTYLPPKAAETKIAGWIYSGKKNDTEGLAGRVLANFKNALMDFESAISGVLKGRRMVTTEHTDGLIGHPTWGAAYTLDEQLRFFNYCITGEDRPVRLPAVPMYLDALIGNQPLLTGIEPQVGDKHIAVIALDGYPQESWPGMLGALDTLSITYRWNTRFIFLDGHEAKAIMNKHRKKWQQKQRGLKDQIFKTSTGAVDLDALQQTNDVESAMSEVESGVLKFGYHTANIIVMHDDPVVLKEQAQKVRKAILELGFGARIETINAVEAWLGSLPGHSQYNVRRPLLHTLNLSDMLPITSVWAGNEFNPCPFYPEQSPPLTYTATTGHTPFRLSLHVGDVGHTLMLGKTGGGKSTALAFLAAQHFRYPDAQVFSFDKGYSGFVLCNAAGGAYYDIAGEQSDLAFCPLAQIDSKEEQSWAVEWVETLLVLQGVTITPNNRSLIFDAVQRLSHSSVRTLTEFVSQIQDVGMRSALNYYTVAGPLGHLLDAEKDGLKNNRYQVFEMEHLMNMGEKAVIPVLLYLFRQVERRLDGRPTLVFIDEAWLALSHPMFREKVREWLKTWRKKNAAAVLATQELADVMNSPIRDAILASCPTKILLPNPEAQEPAQRDWYHEIGLNNREIEILATATPKRHYYYKSPSGRRVFDLGLGAVALAFVAKSSPDHIKQARTMIAQYGESWPAHWLDQHGLSDWGDYWRAL